MPICLPVRISLAGATCLAEPVAILAQVRRRFARGRACAWRGLARATWPARLRGQGGGGRLGMASRASLVSGSANRLAEVAAALRRLQRRVDVLERGSPVTPRVTPASMQGGCGGSSAPGDTALSPSLMSQASHTAPQSASRMKWGKIDKTQGGTNRKQWRNNREQIEKQEGKSNKLLFRYYKSNIKLL